MSSSGSGSGKGSASGSAAASGGSGSASGSKGQAVSVASGSGGASRNKCANEKRRREQENIYIEELAELISASIADLSTSMAVKPDKCAILQETVNQIRRIKAAEELAVQQGEVSSSTNILANEILCPLVLEALDGFLFVVNSDGVVEFCSENVEGFVGFKGEELVGKSIYNVVHLGDHARFSSSLLPMSIGWTTPTPNPTPSTSTSQPTETPTQPKQRSFNIRLLVKSMETPTDASYENMQITAMLMPNPSSGAGGTPTSQGAESGSSSGSCLVCIARRLPPNERPPGMPVEQFTTKLSTDGMIIGVDTSGLSGKWVGIVRKDNTISANNSTLLQELCLPSDLPKLDSHLRETLQNGSSTSLLYKMKLSQDKLVTVQTKSKFFSYTPSTSPSNFIMATHTILNQDSPPPQNPPSSTPPFDILDSFETLVNSWDNDDHNKQPTFLDSPFPQQQTQSPIYYFEEEQEFPGDRLRNLLTNKSENKILKGLLNAEEEDRSENNMLLKLLNERERPAGNELLNQLLSDNPLKRQQEPRLPPGFMPKQQILQPPAPGELCKRNPRLVSLLAKPSESNQTIPTVPSNYISGTPQEKLFQNIKLRSNTSNYHQHHQHLNNDLILDEILDQVIDIVPDQEIYYEDSVGNILNMLESGLVRDGESVRINAIQKELMQFEREQMLERPQQPHPPTTTQNPNPTHHSNPPPNNPTDPVVIHRTTTTTTTQIRYNQQKPQQLLQQQLVQKRMQEQQQQRQRLLLQQLQQQQQPQQSGQLFQLMRSNQSLDSLLGNSPPPNVTLVQQGNQLNGGQQQHRPLQQQPQQQQQHLLQQQLLLQRRQQQQQQQWNQQQLLLKQQILQGQQQVLLSQVGNGGQLQGSGGGAMQQGSNNMQQVLQQQQQQRQQPHPTTPQQLNNPLLNAQLSSQLSQQPRPQQQPPQQQNIYRFPEQPNLVTTQQQQQQRGFLQQRSQQVFDVRQELRAVVGARQAVPQQQLSQQQLQGQLSQQQLQQQQLMGVAPDLEALGIGGDLI